MGGDFDNNVCEHAHMAVMMDMAMAMAMAGCCCPDIGGAC